jgi:hypothetical protein
MSNSSDTGNWPEVRQEALDLVEAATARGLVLRLVGSVGIRLHHPAMERLMDVLRPVPKDLDFVCRKQDRTALKGMLEERGYDNDRNMMVAMEGLRYLFSHPETGLKIDIFVDRLDFCHRVEFSDDLETHPVSIPMEQLLLHKLQIVDLTEGDLLDIGIMLATVPSDEEGGDYTYSTGKLMRPLAEDWGFWRTVVGNLERVRERAASGGYRMIGDEAAQARIADRASALMDAAHDVSKTLKWKMRSKVGERMQWWQEVDDREGTY